MVDRLSEEDRGIGVREGWMEGAEPRCVQVYPILLNVDIVYVGVYRM